MHFRAKNHFEKQVLPHSQIPQKKKNINSVVVVRINYSKHNSIIKM
jgi:hypothetical protein